MMLNLVKDKLFLVLIALLGMTLMSWLLISSANLGVMILLLAFLKVRLIAIHFMEAAMAHRLVRIAFDAWGVVVGGGIIFGYLIG